MELVVEVIVGDRHGCFTEYRRKNTSHFLKRLAMNRFHFMEELREYGLDGRAELHWTKNAKERRFTSWAAHEGFDHCFSTVLYQ